jgi:hypothetical protein
LLCNANLPKLASHENFRLRGGQPVKDGTRPTFFATASDADVNQDGKISLPRSWQGAGAAALATANPNVAACAGAIISLLHPDVGPPFAAPSETDLSGKWDGWSGWLVTGTLGARVAYQALRDIDRAAVKNEASGVFVMEYERGKNDRQVNDFLVTRASAECRFRGSPFVTGQWLSFQGKMHGNVCDKEVGQELCGRKVLMVPYK